MTCANCKFSCKSADNEPCERFKNADLYGENGGVAECASCPHQGLCFKYLEIAGGVTREGRPICTQCNEIKADPEKMEKQLKEFIEKWKRVIESAHAEGGKL